MSLNLNIELTAAGFSLANARACAHASRLAYSPAAVAMTERAGVEGAEVEKSESPRGEGQERVESGRAHCLVYGSGISRSVEALVGGGREDRPTPGAQAYQLFAFRGTTSILDWLTDGEAWMTPGPRGAIHHGFLDSLNSILAALRAKVCVEEDHPIFVTGHSKGGAEALLFAQALTVMGVRASRIHCYTFGQPRVGDQEFAEHCDRALPGRHWRFVNRADIVPRLAGYLCGYRHSGQEAFHPLFGKVSFATPLWQKLITDAAVLFLEWKNGRFAVLNDHHVDLYNAWLGEEKWPVASGQWPVGREGGADEACASTGHPGRSQQEEKTERLDNSSPLVTDH